MAENQQKSEIEHMIDIDRLAHGGAAVEIAPGEAERASLAKRFGFVELPAFSARVTVDRRIGGQVVVEGRLRGRIIQACILTLEPVIQELDDTFRVVFKQNLAEELDPESGEALLNAQSDAPEPLEGHMLDVGEIVAEHLSLVADPYPRKEGVTFEDVLPTSGKGEKIGENGEKGEQRPHPFAGLAALRDKPRSSR
jgi:uncharacterized metal-binding protein YceD (DUF177 family)